ncbi:MAG: UDP-N-acetylmuramoyl-L-alanyl-D-glutamate--2,6-diaminopimelate ligase, partial [Spirochaetes bacterium]|nr:UDP-N-acetylmuramoyl-L-alanyl-D-glutamate--2,6-diaminopimelate ligase [Spirochaetota bacterium]
KIAITNSDYVVVTSDNPRTENPSGIIDAILKGIQNSEKPFVALEDRRNAIEFAVKEAKTGDIVLIVGKGHETYQVFKNRTIHFDDREEALKALETIS